MFILHKKSINNDAMNFTLLTEPHFRSNYKMEDRLAALAKLTDDQYKNNGVNIPLISKLVTARCP